MTHMLEGVARWGTGSRAYSGLQRPVRRQNRHHQRGQRRLVLRLHAQLHVRRLDWLPRQPPLGSGKNYTGGRLACPVWTEFMIRAEEGLPVKEFEVPDGVEFFDVDRHTGHRGGSFSEAYIEGTGPTNYSAPAPLLEPAPQEEFNVQLLETL